MDALTSEPQPAHCIELSGIGTVCDNGMTTIGILKKGLWLGLGLGLRLRLGLDPVHFIFTTPDHF